MINPEPSERLERALRDLYAAPPLDDQKVRSLEEQLLLKMVQEQARKRSPKGAIWEGLSFPRAIRLNWQTVAVGAFIILSLFVLTAGPQRVLAQIQSLVRYIPGMGFFSPETARTLTEPVSEMIGEVKLVVSEFVTTPARTIAVLEIDGLPTESLAQIELSSMVEARLLLPDGTIQSYEEMIGFIDWLTGKGNIFLKFRPLPPGINHLILEVSNPNFVLTNSLPDNWRLGLNLRPALETKGGELAQTYDLLDVRETRHGVTLRILTVAYRANLIALRAHLQWPQETWEFREGLTFLNAGFVELSDNLGNIYEQINDPGGMWVTEAEVFPDVAGRGNREGITGGRAIEQSLTFAPVRPEARQLTLKVDDIGFYVPPRALGEIGFEIDLGEHPQVGDHWPLDLRLNVAGFPVHFTSARIIEDAPGPHWGVGLELKTEPVPARNGYSLTGYTLYAKSAGFTGAKLEPAPNGGFTAILYMKDGMTIPEGPIQIIVEDATVKVEGPWEMTFVNPFAR